MIMIIIMGLVALVISIASIAISISSYNDFIKCEKFYENKLSRVRFKLNKIYGFIDFKRTEVNKEKINYEELYKNADTMRQKNAYRIGSFVEKKKEELLKEIADHIQSDIDV